MPAPPFRPPRVAVVGAGISGLAAAHRLRALLGDAAEIVVVEQRDRIGGVLHTVELAGVPYDMGAEAYLARRPEVGRLLGELGLADAQVHPTPASATVRAAGRTRPLPGGTLLGVPTGRARLDGLLSPAGLAAVAAEPGRPLHWTPGADPVLGQLLRERFGDELADRLADPLLGGVYAGRVDALGLRATVPPLAAALDAGAPSLTAAADTRCMPAASGARPGLRGAARRLPGAAGRAGRRGRGRAAAGPTGQGAAPPPVRLAAGPRPDHRPGAARRRRGAARRPGPGRRSVAGRRGTRLGRGGRPDRAGLVGGGRARLPPGRRRDPARPPPAC